MNYNVKQSGERIRQLRIESRYTQEDLAKVLHVDRSFLSRVEAGSKGCSVDLFVQISNVFHVSLDYLILGKKGSNSLDAERVNHMKAEIDQIISYLNTFRSAL